MKGRRDLRCAGLLRASASPVFVRRAGVLAVQLDQTAEVLVRETLVPRPERLGAVVGPARRRAGIMLFDRSRHFFSPVRVWKYKYEPTGCAGSASCSDRPTDGARPTQFVA